MKKLLLIPMTLSLNLSAMHYVTPDVETVKIFAAGSAVAFTYAALHNIVKSLRSPEYFLEGHLDNQLKEYSESAPETTIKQLCKKAKTPLQRTLLFTFHKKNCAVILIANALITAAARMPLHGYTPLTLNEVIMPLSTGVEATAIAALATDIISERVTERTQTSYFPTETLAQFKTRVKLPQEIDNKKLYKYMGAVYSDWANYIVGPLAALGAAGYLLNVRSHK